MTGIGGWLPPDVVTNEQLSQRMDTSDEWIRTRTGISERRVVSPGISTVDLAVEAGLRALKSAQQSAVDAVVVATTSPERLCPAAGPEVASRLGLTGIAAYDIASACSGFLYGLATANGLVESGVADSVLLIGAEAFTTLVNPDDRTTAPIFGDGAAAVVLRRGGAEELGALGRIDLGSDGELADLLMIPAGGSRQRSASGGLGHGEVRHEDWYLRMEGRALFREAVTRMADSSRAVLDRTGWSVDDIDHYIAHQANIRIVQAVADELGVPEEKVATNIAEVGNTLAASVPLLLIDTALQGRLRPGDRVVLSAFGAGLSWGSATLTWPEMAVESPR